MKARNFTKNVLLLVLSKDFTRISLGFQDFSKYFRNTYFQEYLSLVASNHCKVIKIFMSFHICSGEETRSWKNIISNMHCIERYSKTWSSGLRCIYLRCTQNPVKHLNLWLKASSWIFDRVLKTSLFSKL